MFESKETDKQVEVEEIVEQLSMSLQKATDKNKNGVLLIGPPGVGKTSFMKYYARLSNKILIYANCCTLISDFQHRTS